MTMDNTRVKRWPAWLLAVVVLPAWIPAWGAPPATSKLYRYVDNKGVVSIDDHVPPEFTKNGYDIMTPDGRVLETVPRQLTGVEGERKRAADAEAKRLQEWDKRLLLRYSSVDDITAARDRALREFDVRISILRSNLLSVKAQIESEQAKAADLERRGSAVPAAMSGNIDMLKRELADTEETIAQRSREKEDLRGKYQQDIERFTTLQDVVRYRRQGVATETQ